MNHRFPPALRGATAFAALLALTLSSTSCFNAFNFIDNPDGDAQLISAGRAALDRGDFEEAVEYYQELSGDAGDVGASEQAFALLAKHGMTMGAFASAFGTGGIQGGKALTSIANTIGSAATETARLDFFRAFKTTENISNASLKGLVRLLSSMALIAEVMAETASDPSHVTTADIASGGTGCTTDAGVCAVAGPCDKPAHSNAINRGSTTSVNLATATVESIQAEGATLALIAGAISQMNAALTEIGGSGGGLSGSVDDITAASDATLAATEGSCYRAVLINTVQLGTY